MASKPRIKLPKKASAGEVITIKTLISHEMESGQRKDKDGNAIPRQIINKFTCAFEGATVFECDLDPAISANPFFEFTAKVNESGTFKFTWVDDDGSVYEAEQAIEVA
ncbi:thiosulfate oxidation carrier complex protein SoxZ [Pseudohoeflea suaedae]|uniref:Thiosulfate oxidation carrier complex protein SoxZ n=1 Tax=Pseudohoeflea suaedae TaxID=877384 RepID=A0A4R5PKQ2_9HYPH|nr:thiosulfate oxidation carrier complex protein SoxZ [Pseudohoeflea suaedae]TDH36311.1 thiosulfate oxidation carrier complex protein SoxZ [Pseudohoeflea suaedae]